MTGRKTRLGLLALFLVATVGTAQTMAFLVDEENAVIHFAGNAAGNVAGGVADTDWGVGNQAVAPGAPGDQRLDPDDRDRSIDGPPPDAMAVAPASAASAPAAPQADASAAQSEALPSAAHADGPVLAVDPPPPVPPPT